VGITPVLIDRFARHPDPNGTHRVESLLGLVELVNRGSGGPEPRLPDNGGSGGLKPRPPDNGGSG
jgi:hypothetical protein